jgi:DnaJ family protein A protein 2
MPSQRHHEPGDLYIKFQVKFPELIDPAVIPSLEKALPPRKPLEKFPKSTIIEEVELDEVDARSRTMQDDPMDGEYAEAEPRVQCANQ